MGLFGGLFNYDKPGPGIDKNAPQKKGLALYFSILKDKFWKLIPLSLLYLLTMLPVLTWGFSEAAAAYITRNFSRRKPVLLASDYFDAIKKNWKQALIVGIINLLATAVIFLALFFYFKNWNVSFFYKVGFVVSGCILIVFTFLKYYINMLIVTFNLTIKQLYKNSMLLSSAGLKQNIIISVILGILYVVLIGLPILWMYISGGDMIGFVLSFVLCVLFLPAIRSYTIQFWIFPVIKQHMIDPYYKEHPEEAKRDRALLNLFEDEEEEEAGESDAVFKDVGTKEIPSDTSANNNEKSIPKQYSANDMRRHSNSANDDDDTI